MTTFQDVEATLKRIFPWCGQACFAVYLVASTGAMVWVCANSERWYWVLASGLGVAFNLWLLDRVRTKGKTET